MTPEAVRRGIRTAGQLLIAIATTIGPLIAVAGVPAVKVATISAALAAAGTTVTVLVNTLEDRGVIPALLKRKPAPPALVDVMRSRGWSEAQIGAAFAAADATPPIRRVK